MMRWLLPVAKCLGSVAIENTSSTVAEKLIGLGRYPEVSLKEARERRDEARRLLSASVDPAKSEKPKGWHRPDTFEAIAREHLTLKSNSLNGARMP